MADIEYVARVVIERIERRVVPKGTAINPRRTSTEDRIVRDKAEIASFTIRDETMHGIKSRVRDVMLAALPSEAVKGEPDIDDDEEEEEDR